MRGRGPPRHRIATPTEPHGRCHDDRVYCGVLAGRNERTLARRPGRTIRSVRHIRGCRKSPGLQWRRQLPTPMPVPGLVPDVPRRRPGRQVRPAEEAAAKPAVERPSQHRSSRRRSAVSLLCCVRSRGQCLRRTASGTIDHVGRVQSAAACINGLADHPRSTMAFS